MLRGHILFKPPLLHYNPQMRHSTRPSTVHTCNRGTSVSSSLRVLLLAGSNSNALSAVTMALHSHTHNQGLVWQECAPHI